MTAQAVATGLDRDGAQHFASLAAPILDALLEALVRWPGGRAGVRIAGDAAIARLVGPQGPVGARAEAIAGKAMKPVRAVLFDKSDTAGWVLGWHQDRTIAVRERRDVPGFGPWSVKQGIAHVEPPFDVMEGMLTARIHLDPVDDANAPLLIAHGSHRLGRIPVDEVEEVAARSIKSACLAAVGDVWFYRTPILHASAAASPGRRRRVLQVDYCGRDLPAGLEWLGI